MGGRDAILRSLGLVDMKKVSKQKNIDETTVDTDQPKPTDAINMSKLSNKTSFSSALTSSALPDKGFDLDIDDRNSIINSNPIINQVTTKENATNEAKDEAKEKNKRKINNKQDTTKTKERRKKKKKEKRDFFDNLFG